MRKSVIILILALLALIMFAILPIYPKPVRYVTTETVERTVMTWAWVPATSSVTVKVTPIKAEDKTIDPGYCIYWSFTKRGGTADAVFTWRASDDVNVKVFTANEANKYLNHQGGEPIIERYGPEGFVRFTAFDGVEYYVFVCNTHTSLFGGEKVGLYHAELDTVGASPTMYLTTTEYPTTTLTITRHTHTTTTYVNLLEWLTRP